MKFNKLNPFESIFHDFVAGFGGEVLEEAPDARTADYFFREHNIIVELKTLIVDSTNVMNRKLAPIIQEWTKKHRQLPTGVVEGDKYIVELKNMPREISDVWLQLLKASIEHLIRDANKQIRDTKERLKLPSAKGMIVIVNEANPYHDDPQDFRRLIAEILRKRTSEGELRFGHVNGAVYFSVKDVKSRNEKMYFWANLQMKYTPDEDVAPIAEFQTELQQAWYRYIEEKTGIKVRQHGQIDSTRS